jgi:hypothetical protein
MEGSDVNYFCADAACINQNKLDEISTQVTIMRQVYMHASIVTAYLGCTQPTSSLGIKALKALAEWKLDDNETRQVWHNMSLRSRQAILRLVEAAVVYPCLGSTRGIVQSKYAFHHRR